MKNVEGRFSENVGRKLSYDVFRNTLHEKVFDFVYVFVCVAAASGSVEAGISELKRVSALIRAALITIAFFQKVIIGKPSLRR